MNEHDDDHNEDVEGYLHRRTLIAAMMSLFNAEEKLRVHVVLLHQCVFREKLFLLRRRQTLQHTFIEGVYHKTLE